MEVEGRREGWMASQYEPLLNAVDGPYSSRFGWI